MIVPRYWARVTSEERTPAGRRVPFSCCQWSERSLAEAQARAREVAERIARRIRGGEALPERYAYGTRPLREEVLRELRGGDDALAAVLTRNAYGAVVLNAAGTMFVDVDLAEPSLREPATRGIAAHRRCDEHRGCDRDLGMTIERLQHQDSAQAVADEMRRLTAERIVSEARQPLDVDLEGAAAAVVEDARGVAVAREPRREQRHRRAGHPQPGNQHHGPAHPAFFSRSRARCTASRTACARRTIG